MKKIIATILLISLILAGSTAVYGKDYTDMKSGHWAYAAVDAMSGKEIIKGYPNGSFLPNNTVTYGEFIKMSLIAATGNDAGNAPSGHWAMNYYNKALELKYFTEHDITKEQLNSKITRSDMALIISSILGDVKIDNYDKIQKGITDITYKTKHEYDITKAYASGILTGYTDKTFRPEKTLTRAESATVIYRLIDESKREIPSGEKDTDPAESKTDISSVVKNYEEIAKSREYLAGAKTYSIITDMSKYKVTLHENRGTKWIEINDKDVRELGFGNMYLVKDKNMVITGDSFADGTYDGNNHNEHIDIATIDYFMFYKTTTNHITLMPNPYHK
jgi:hypothetical protein